MTCEELRAQIAVLDAAITVDQAAVTVAVANFTVAIGAVGAANQQLAADQSARDMAQMELTMRETMGMC